MFTYAENCQITILAEATQKSKQTMEARWSAAEFCVIFKKASIYLFIRLGEWKHQFLSSMDPSQLSFTRFPLDWITAYRVSARPLSWNTTEKFSDSRGSSEKYFGLYFQKTQPEIYKVSLTGFCIERFAERSETKENAITHLRDCLLYTSPSPRD